MTRTCFQSCSSFTGRNMNGGGSTLLSAGFADAILTALWYFHTQLAQTQWPSELLLYHAVESETNKFGDRYTTPKNKDVTKRHSFDQQIRLEDVMHQMVRSQQYTAHPHCTTMVSWSRGTLFPSCPFTSPSFALFYFSLFSLVLTIFFFCPSLSFLPE